jgi:hypothetical protein
MKGRGKKIKKVCGPENPPPPINLVLASCLVSCLGRETEEVSRALVYVREEEEEPGPQNLSPKLYFCRLPEDQFLVP